MKAAVWHNRLDIRVEEFPDPPAPRDDEITIKVSWCGICGTDVEEYLYGPLFIPVGTPNPMTGRMAPMVMGHEFVGTVAAVGKAVTDLKIGDVVAPDTLIHCGECYWCQRHEVHRCEKLAILGLTTDGGLAEYVNAPRYMCFKLPPGVPEHVGALAEPASVAVRANRRGRTGPGDIVCVVGAGAVGLFCLQVARISGASQVYVLETQPNRLAVAEQMGATAAFNPLTVDPVEAIKQVTGGRGADVVIEAGGVEKTMLLAPYLARKGGCVVFLGQHNEPAPFNFFPLVVNEWELIGSFSHIYDEDFSAAVAFLGDGRINGEPLITGRIRLDDLVEKGLKQLIEHKSENLKILVSPQLA